MTRGRPTKYEPWMCDKAIELMSEGASMIEVAAECDIDVDTVKEWRKTNPDFSAAIKKGLALSNRWWEKEARISLRDKDFNHVLWYMNMKNRFRDTWYEKQHNEVNVTTQESIDKVKENLAKYEKEY